MLKLEFLSTISIQQKSEWDEFWGSCDHAHFRQNYRLADIEKAKKLIPLFVIGKSYNKIVCAGIFGRKPLFSGSRILLEAICLRGPAFDELHHAEEYLFKIIKYFKENKIGQIRISPYWFYPEAKDIEKLLEALNFKPLKGSHRDPSAIVDLRRNNKDLISSFNKKTRYELKLSEKLGIIVRSAINWKEAEWAYENLNLLRRKRGLTLMARGEFKETFKKILYKQDYGKLFIALYQEKYLGALWSIRGSKIANVVGYVVDDKMTKDNGINITIGVPLFYKAFQWAKENDCEQFDLEGAVDVNDPNDSLYRVHQFKRRFNPSSVERLNEHIYVCNKTISSLLFLINIYLNKKAKSRKHLS